MREKIRDKGRLEHILESTNYVIEFINGIEFEDFLKNKILQFAVVKNLEIIGEASYKLTNDFRDNHPEIEWRRIISMRHILVHGYYDTNEMIVWDTAKSLAVFREKIQMLYEKEI
ncbi:MAG: DUF86 domain-containing protein [Bacteroidales bacterium]|jgi:uncharacterized protein with HEPN domain|nr:DUF86 domain-containing protein [Bacteroidales bacterium]